MAKSNLPKSFVTADEFEERLDMQQYLAKNYLDLLRRNDKILIEFRKMEFFFYSKTREKAIDLKQDLENLGNEIYGIGKSSGQQYSIEGVTPPMSLAEDNFKAWIKIMNETGFINDCEFDGWGTISLSDEAEPFQNC